MNTKEYWENRYANGGNSGSGSMGKLAEYKAEFVSRFISEEGIYTVGDFGCGNSMLASQFVCTAYYGYDIADNIGALNISGAVGEKYDLTISLDVIFHLLEDSTFENYMNLLFDASSKYVIIYSSNGDCGLELAPHMIDREFTDWVSENKPEFELIYTEKNRYSFDINNPTETSISNWYIYSWKASQHTS